MWGIFQLSGIFMGRVTVTDIKNEISGLHGSVFKIPVFWNKIPFN
jgi:hypothetical protein